MRLRKESITRIINNFETFGCLFPHQHKIQAPIQNYDRFTFVVGNELTSTLREVTRKSDISYTTVAKILKKNKYHSYNPESP